MKLEPGKASYLLPVKMDRIVDCVVSDKDGGHGAFKVSMAQLNLADIIAQRQKAAAFDRPAFRAIPTHYALNGDHIEFWPPPDKTYDCVVRYWPPPITI